MRSSGVTSSKIMFWLKHCVICEQYLVGCKDTVLGILDKHLLFLQGTDGKHFNFSFYYMAFSLCGLEDGFQNLLPFPIFFDAQAYNKAILGKMQTADW